MTRPLSYFYTTDIPNLGTEAYTYAHPLYRKFQPEWTKIRDVIAGEEQVKSKGELYLPDICQGSKGCDQKGYEQYKKRAVFTAFASRTLDGFLGTVFRRDVRFNSSKKEFNYDNFVAPSSSIQLLMRRLGAELFANGRTGVRVFYHPEKEQDHRAEMKEYPAENILSWEEDENGEVIYVLLRDIKLEVRKPFVNKSNNTLYEQFTALYLDGNGELNVVNYDQDFEVTGHSKPTIKGVPIKKVPFFFFSPDGNSVTVSRPPMRHIVDMNLAHYRTSANLEMGRFYAGFPIYVVPVGPTEEDTDTYQISPSKVWEVPLESKPFVLEFYGQGLNHLAEALVEKERQIVQLGARMIGIRSLDTKYEAPSIFELLYQAELSLLVNLTDVMNKGMKMALETCFEFNSYAGDPESWDINVEVSQEFKTTNLVGRDLKAIALMVDKGLLPSEEAFKILQSAEFISSEMTFEQFDLLVKREQKEKFKQQLAQQKEQMQLSQKFGNNNPQNKNGPPKVPGGKKKSQKINLKVSDRRTNYERDSNA